MIGGTISIKARTQTGIEAVWDGASWHSSNPELQTLLNDAMPIVEEQLADQYLPIPSIDLPVAAAKKAGMEIVEMPEIPEIDPDVEY